MADQLAIARPRCRPAFAHGHLLSILIRPLVWPSGLEGCRFAFATATVSLLGWHRERRVVRTINHRFGDQIDPPMRVSAGNEHCAGCDALTIRTNRVGYARWAGARAVGRARFHA